MTAVREWLKKVDEPKTVQASGPWEQYTYSRTCTNDTQKLYDKVCVDRYYYKLSNDGNPTYDYFSVEIRFEQMSGQAAYEQNWKNEWAYAEANVTRLQAGNLLLQYGPTSTVRQVSASYSLGVTAGDKGGGISATYSQGYSQPDVT